MGRLSIGNAFLATLASFASCCPCPPNTYDSLSTPKQQSTISSLYLRMMKTGPAPVCQVKFYKTSDEHPKKSMCDGHQFKAQVEAKCKEEGGENDQV